MTNKTAKLQENSGRTKEDIAEDDIKELECLAEHGCESFGFAHILY